ncbi:MAG: cell adhesion protein, partial [Isosphaeraceae bacterium]
MSNDARRARARRRAWGRGPMILRFEPLEDRELLAAAVALPDVAPVAIDTVHNLAWGDSFHAKGIVANQGTAPAANGFHVNIYASPTAAIGVNSTLIGQATS